MLQKKQKNIPHKLNAYKQTDVITANRETLLLMLYKAAIVSLKKGIKAAKEENIGERNEHVQKTQEIVSELRSTLNFSVAGDIAQELNRLYIFISQRLLEGCMDNNIKFLQEALKTLETLNEAWNEAIASLKKENTDAPSK